MYQGIRYQKVNIKFLLNDNDINQEKSKAVLTKENKNLEDLIKNLGDKYLI
jgi:hypothetical protein